MRVLIIIVYYVLYAICMVCARISLNNSYEYVVKFSLSFVADTCKIG